MLLRSFVVALLVLLLPACGGSGSTGTTTTSGAPLDTKAAVLVTTDCGQKTVLRKSSVEPGQTAMRALDTVADIDTDSGGKFVTAVEGVQQDTGKKLAWLYYINGKAAQKGAAEVKLAPGDVEWWDLHNYEHECATVPAEAK